MTFTRTHAAVMLVAVASSAAAAFSIHAQTQATPQTPQQAAFPATAAPASQIPQPAARPASSPPPRAVIFLDPAHGGSETGAALGNNIAEKDAVLAFSQRLRSALASASFTVVTTRDGDLSAPLPTDQRAETANRAHALACIVIHATASGAGVHLFTSALSPAPANDATGAAGDSATPFTPIAWESAQAGYIDQSRKLLDVMKASAAKTGLPILTGSAPLRPLDNLMCPALAIEIAPNAAGISANDGTYQQQIVVAVASALQMWRDQSSGGAQ